MKILVKRQGALGDVLEVTPIIARLRREQPDALIHVETAYRDVFTDNPHISKVPPPLEYDRVVDLNMAFESALRKLHPIDAYSEVAFGDQLTPHVIEFSKRSFSRKGRPFVVIHPARSWPIRTLSREWWQELINLLLEHYEVAITGTAQDWDGLDSVADYRGQLSLGGQAGLIESAACFICSESGPAILAQATDVPIVELLTMVPPEHVMHERNGERGWRFYPVRANVPCVGCATEQPAASTYFDCKFGHRDCVRAFDAQAVAELVCKVAR